MPAEPRRSMPAKAHSDRSMICQASFSCSGDYLLQACGSPQMRASDAADRVDARFVSANLIEPPCQLPPTKWWPYESATVAPACSLSSQVSTMIIQNIARALNPVELRSQIDRSGFGGLYDIFYMPVCVKTRQNKGYAFVNFDSAEIAQRFATAWSGMSRLGLVQAGKRPQRLAVSPAEEQGSRANYARLVQKKVFRIKDPALRPFVRDALRIESQLI
eukprot:TRINITY_DN9600_c0_g1_i1.p1 TRINITY_DN9600_c0_g1~~TRINITY_DN9600_c0_g1_i1.p1  ORF type:complete len:232 (+),score=31.82 TRINITY_DN9600_c0_g1_i1:45-698(+)